MEIDKLDTKVIGRDAHRLAIADIDSSLDGVAEGPEEVKKIRTSLFA
jgi:hypothetical protein